MDSQPPGNAPQQTPPPSWQQAPAGPPGWPEEAVPPPEGRPVQVTGAAIVLIVLGVIIGLLGVLFLLVGAMFGQIITMPEFQNQFGDVSPQAGGVFVVFGSMFLLDGVTQVVAGIFILPGRSWARLVGLIGGIIGALFALIGVLPGQSGGGVNLFFLVVLAGYVYVVWVLATRGDWFRRAR